MNESDLIEWMITEKIAHHPRHAGNIILKLHLGELDNDEAQKARCQLYREWRRAGENSDVAAIRAIKGEAAPQRLIEAKTFNAGTNWFETPEGKEAAANIHVEIPAMSGTVIIREGNNIFVGVTKPEEPAPLSGMTGAQLADYFSDKTEEE